jgi:outer membrane protein assembly factor BamB
LTAFDKNANRLETICLDQSSGTILWRKPAPFDTLEKLHDVNNPAAASPASDGIRVYAYFGSAGLFCYDLDGNEVWSHRLAIPETRFGSASSPVVADGLVLLAYQKGKGSVLAVDAATGANRWHRENLSFGVGYAVPVVLRRENGTEILAQGTGGLTSLAITDGSPKWNLAGLARAPIATPVLGGDLLYVVSFHSSGATEDRVEISFDETLREHDTNADGRLTADEAEDVITYKRGDAHGLGDITLAQAIQFFDENGDGGLDEKEFNSASAHRPDDNALLAVRPIDSGTVRDSDIAWREKGSLPESPSPLFYRDRLYTIKNGGIISCYDAKTGKRHFRRRLSATGSYYASPVAGDGKVYLCSMNGIVTVLAADDRFNKLSENDLQETIMSTPAIAGGTIYIRTAGQLRAFRS